MSQSDKYYLTLVSTNSALYKVEYIVYICCLCVSQCGFIGISLEQGEVFQTSVVVPSCEASYIMCF